MRRPGLYWLWLPTAVYLAAARAATPAPGSAALRPSPSASVTSACERGILRDPFVPPAARSAVERHAAAKFHLLRDLLPTRILPADGGRMGWTVPDTVYWDRLPVEVKRLPQDWSRLPGVRFSSGEIGGTRTVRLLRGSRYDQWLLDDPGHHLTAVIGVERRTRRPYFAEVERVAAGRYTYKPAFDNCYRCHASGPRIIRPLNSAGVDHNALAALNRAMFSYGACDFGDTVSPSVRGPEIGDRRCAGCHDGRHRGRLYAVHAPTIAYKTATEMTMPP